MVSEVSAETTGGDSKKELYGSFLISVFICPAASFIIFFRKSGSRLCVGTICGYLPFYNLVNNYILLCLFRVHVKVSIRVLFYLRQRFTCMFGENLVQ